MNNLFDVKGKIAVVTGGSRGIGMMIAEGFVRNGVKTYISSRKADVCDGAAKKLSAYGTCISVPADLSTLEGIDHLAREVGAREDRLHILVNNAGATWARPSTSFPSRAGTR